MSAQNSKGLGLLKSIPKNAFSGFVVSLIALPLCLGLAMASEAPPISGIVAAVVGGVVVAVFGGSHVTITGPGNGLVGVLLAAFITLGAEGAYAAVICSGGLLIVLGFLRLGKLADFFPNSAIQGMLAAIGLIILGKQFHIMLGNKILRDTSIEYLIEIPATIIASFSYQERGLQYAALVGVISLFIMIFYPRIRNRYLQLIPAPMWIVILSVGFSYYCELVAEIPNPIAADYMISGIPKPAAIIEELPGIDFSLATRFNFWIQVLALTLIASVESLLSIKAVDKLDPQKRRSNVNKDIKALGLATIGSGFLGGLNVVAVIARSSVNVNNGGSNRWSNFFHAFFLVVFIALFSTQLERVPLPALMAILVYTGYRLASPNLIRKIFSVGREQLLIFFTTLLVTLQIDLISGILAGVLVTFIIHCFVAKGPALFLRNLLKPNVLMFKEEESGTYYLGVKHFCSFLNYYKLKAKIDAIPEDQEVVLDVSTCRFVDHTVLENLHDVQDLFSKRGGHFEVIGMEFHDSSTSHPFALRRVLKRPKTVGQTLTRRQLNIAEFAEQAGGHFEVEKDKEIRFLYDFEFFKTRTVDYLYNRVGQENDQLQLFDVHYSEGALIAKEVIRATMLYIPLQKNIPHFILEREGILEKVYSLTGQADIDIEGYADFSNRFYLHGENSEDIRNYFSPELIRFFESSPYYHVESNGHGFLVFTRTRLASLKEIKALMDFGKRLAAVVID